MPPGKEQITCITCSRCGYPVCTIDDIICETVGEGLTDAVFQYGLEGILNLDTPVPCYSRMEAVTWTVSLTPGLLKLPALNSLRKKLLEGLIRSERAKGRPLDWEDAARQAIEEEEEEEGIAFSALEEVMVGGVGSLLQDEQTTNSSFMSDDSDESRCRNSGSEGGESSVIPSLPADTLDLPESMFETNKVFRSRTDIICVSHGVLDYGVLPCVKKRRTCNDGPSPLPPQLSHSEEDYRCTADGNHSEGEVDVERIESGVPTTLNSSVAGETGLGEAGFSVETTVLSTKVPWFQNFISTGCVECRDCHLALGFIFEKREEDDVNTVDSSTPQEERESPAFFGGTSLPSPLPSEEPLSKREKREGKDCVSSSSSLSSSTSKNLNNSHKKFLGIEVKKITVKEWSLGHFQKRYEASHDMELFRSLFPGVMDVEAYKKKIMSLQSYADLLEKFCAAQKELLYKHVSFFSQMQDQMVKYRAQLKQKDDCIASLQKKMSSLFEKCLDQCVFIEKQSSSIKANNQRLSHLDSIVSGQDETIKILRERLEILQKIHRLLLNEQKS